MQAYLLVKYSHIQTICIWITTTTHARIEAKTGVYLKLASLSVGTARDMLFRDELSRPEWDLAAVIIEY